MFHKIGRLLENLNRDQNRTPDKANQKKIEFIRVANFIPYHSYEWLNITFKEIGTKRIIVLTYSMEFETRVLMKIFYGTQFIQIASVNCGKS